MIEWTPRQIEPLPFNRRDDKKSPPTAATDLAKVVFGWAYANADHCIPERKRLSHCALAKVSDNRAPRLIVIRMI
ncbi:MAG TPA: hypothetical protein VGC19_01965 [Rhodanobacter sp.]